MYHIQPPAEYVADTPSRIGSPINHPSTPSANPEGVMIVDDNQPIEMHRLRSLARNPGDSSDTGGVPPIADDQPVLFASSETLDGAMTIDETNPSGTPSRLSDHFSAVHLSTYNAPILHTRSTFLYIHLAKSYNINSVGRTVVKFFPVQPQTNSPSTGPSTGPSTTLIRILLHIQDLRIQSMINGYQQVELLCSLGHLSLSILDISQHETTHSRFSLNSPLLSLPHAITTAKLSQSQRQAAIDRMINSHHSLDNLTENLYDINFLSDSYLNILLSPLIPV